MTIEIEAGEADLDWELKEVMTDVSDYAAEIGIPYRVCISPQILIDIKEVGRESDLSNLMAILESARDEIDIPAALKSGRKRLSFVRLMDVGEDHLSDYKVIAHFTLNELNQIQVKLMREEEAERGIDTSEAMIGHVNRLQAGLSAPEVWWSKRPPKGYSSKFSV